MQSIAATERVHLSSAEETIQADVFTYDVVIITQSCDLQQNKVDYVTVCPHWDFDQAKKENPSLGKSGTIEQILKRRMARYAMIDAADFPNLKMSIRIVDFGQVFSIPKENLSALAAKSGKRLRLLPPYREYLAQCFAGFFMRVGLPEEIKLDS